MSTFNIEQIRQTIDSIQKTHPVLGFFDVTKINDENAVDIIKNEIDKYLAKATQDTDIYIICEMAKQYINGVRPTVEVRPIGEWIYTNKEDKQKGYGGYCSVCKCDMPIGINNWKQEYYESKFCPNCGTKMKGAEE